MISRAHLAHNLVNSYAMSRQATPIATPSPTSRATFTPMSNHTQNNTQGAHIDRNTITPPGVGISLLSRGYHPQYQWISVRGAVMLKYENLQKTNWL